ncbi:hypothetical protein [Fimbriiglobus ruber]|uniref:Uncharacterized protein n=1 Tax=Fimbriiglobus ruber TaxID=1908690 RepID=A0A225DXX6_9BACT|nr:hypothetical protein [Fimbriiglobus ruber]OWK40967.1 hypothetical protein FRUB_04859 [Fimbriiglobus ruber]
MTTFETEQVEDLPDRIDIRVDSVYDVVLSRTPEGLVIDVYPLRGGEKGAKNRPSFTRPKARYGPRPKETCRPNSHILRTGNPGRSRDVN